MWKKGQALVPTWTAFAVFGLLEQHFADRAQLLRVPVALAQQPRIGVRTAVAELRKLERDDIEVREVGRNLVRHLVAAQLDAERLAAHDKGIALGAPLLEAHDDRAVRRQRLLGAYVDERVLDELAEWLRSGAGSRFETAVG